MRILNRNIGYLESTTHPHSGSSNIGDTDGHALLGDGNIPVVMDVIMLSTATTIN